MKLDMQFINHHRKQFLDLQAELIKINYSPQTEATLTNFNTLLLLEIALSFPGFDWSPPMAFESRLQDSAVLVAAAPADDDDDSGQEQSAAAAPAPVTAALLLQVWIRRSQSG
jgi:hypothetical protein